MVTLMASVPPVSSAGVATRAGDRRPWSDSVLDGALLDFLKSFKNWSSQSLTTRKEIGRNHATSATIFAAATVNSFWFLPWNRI